MPVHSASKGAQLVLSCSLSPPLWLDSLLLVICLLADVWLADKVVERRMQSKGPWKGRVLMPTNHS